MDVIPSLCFIYSLQCCRDRQAASRAPCGFSCHTGLTLKPTPLADQEAHLYNKLLSQSHRQTWSAQTKTTGTTTTTTRKPNVAKVKLKILSSKS